MNAAHSHAICSGSAYVGQQEAEALQAKVPTKDEARRIAVDVAHLPQRQLASASDILTVPDHAGQDYGAIANLRANVAFGVGN
jgi:hypothetical protein